MPTRDFEQMADSARTVTMPRLACMKAMRDERLTFSEVAEGQRGKSGKTDVAWPSVHGQNLDQPDGGEPV